MAILVDSGTRVVIQGITGHNGRNIASRMKETGTPLIGGVTPGRGGGYVCDVPVFDSCEEAVARAGANATLISVPAPFALDACQEALEAGIRLVVVYTEAVPVRDAIRMAAHARARGAVVLGPNSAGCVSPGLANLSDMNDLNLDRGRIGIVSKSGTLACEVVDGLREVGLGESTIVCLGGDEVTVTGHGEILQLFAEDPETDLVVLIGEIGGRAEVIAAELLPVIGKPVVAYIAGRHAPPAKRMGHAGAVLATNEETASAKIAVLAAQGAVIADQIVDLAQIVRAILD